MSETEMLKLADLFKERCLDYYEADSTSIDASKPNVVVELVYEDFKAYPSRNLSVIDKSKVLGVGIDIGFINIWNALLK